MWVLKILNSAGLTQDNRFTNVTLCPTSVEITKEPKYQPLGVARCEAGTYLVQGKN